MCNQPRMYFFFFSFHAYSQIRENANKLHSIGRSGAVRVYSIFDYWKKETTDELLKQWSNGSFMKLCNVLSWHWKEWWLFIQVKWTWNGTFCGFSYKRTNAIYQTFACYFEIEFSKICIGRVIRRVGRKCTVFEPYQFFT